MTPNTIYPGVIWQTFPTTCLKNTVNIIQICGKASKLTWSFEYLITDMFFRDQKVYQHSAGGKFNFPWLPTSKAVIAVMPGVVCVSDRMFNVLSYVFAWTVFCYLVSILQGLLVPWPTVQILGNRNNDPSNIFCSVTEHEQERSWDRRSRNSGEVPLRWTQSTGSKA